MNLVANVLNKLLIAGVTDEGKSYINNYSSTPTPTSALCVFMLAPPFRTVMGALCFQHVSAFICLFKDACMHP